MYLFLPIDLFKFKILERRGSGGRKTGIEKGRKGRKSKNMWEGGGGMKERGRKRWIRVGGRHEFGGLEGEHCTVKNTVI